MSLPERPLTILIAALGGEGGGVMADWLMEAVTRSGFPAQATSIPGVAQYAASSADRLRASHWATRSRSASSSPHPARPVAAA